MSQHLERGMQILQATVKTLLGKGISQREINRKTRVDRKAIRKYGREDNLEAGKGALPHNRRIIGLDIPHISA